MTPLLNSLMVPAADAPVIKPAVADGLPTWTVLTTALWLGA